MKRIRGGSGLGDALYVRVIADHLIRSGESVEACSDYVDVFIGSGVQVSPFRRDRIDVLAHYSARKTRPDTTQWQDICGTAGVGDVPLKLDWTVRNNQLVKSMVVKAAGRRIILVHGGRNPMGRTDGFGIEMLPEKEAFNHALDALQNCFLVRVGKGRQVYQLQSHIDLNGQTTIPDLFDLASICDGVIAQCSFAVPLAECFDKPLLAIWAARGLSSGQQYVKAITPQKILSKPTSTFVMDDCRLNK